MVRVFISYSHKDTWLLNELKTVLAPMERSQLIECWYDGDIHLSDCLDPAIEAALHHSDLFISLVSPDYLASRYCYEVELQTALSLARNNRCRIIPLIVRECQWKSTPLAQFKAAPKDGVPVCDTNADQANTAARDKPWQSFASLLEELIKHIHEVKQNRGSLLDAHVEQLFRSAMAIHPTVGAVDERSIFVFPNLADREQDLDITTMDQLCEKLLESRATLIAGSDRSGKTLLSKMIQYEISARRRTIIVNGDRIKNIDVDDLVGRLQIEQYGQKFPSNECILLIDDIDNCKLSDRLKDTIFMICSQKEITLVVTAYSSTSAALLANDFSPNPLVLEIKKFDDIKIMDLVKKWAAIDEDDVDADKTVLRLYGSVQTVFSQTGGEKTPHAIVFFLSLLETLSANDLSRSSYAACYDALISAILAKNGCPPNQFDEVKNFLAHVAFDLHRLPAPHGPDVLEATLDSFVEQFFSSKDELRIWSNGIIKTNEDASIAFSEEYIFYFFIAKFVSRYLAKNNRSLYEDFIESCTSRIFEKRFANIIIFISYLSEDDFVLQSTLKVVDQLFSKADDWEIKDEFKDLMYPKPILDRLQLEGNDHVEENRRVLLQRFDAPTIERAQQIVAKYTLPFLGGDVEDSSLIESLDTPHPELIDLDSYCASANALLRAHSVIGHILSTRTGTFSASTLNRCLNSMVRASGRYANLNLSIAKVLIYQLGTDEQLATDSSTDGDVQEDFAKAVRMFSYWAPLIALSGLARYVALPHTVRALEKLARSFEFGDTQNENVSYSINFTATWLIAELYLRGSIDKDLWRSAVKKFGDNSALYIIFRQAVFTFSSYMPMDFSDRQWISSTFRINQQALQTQHMRQKLLQSPKDQSS